MTKRTLVTLLFLGFISSLFGQQVSQIRNQFLNAHAGTVLVASHRAAHIKYPENSLPAISEAIRLGVDIIETDVKVTKDGVPVLMHDGTINRTTTGSGKPSDYTLAELRKFKLIHHGDTTNYQIPTFDEALKLTKNHIMVDIDLKTDQLDPIIKVINNNDCQDQVFFFDNDYNALQYVREQDAAFMLMPRAYSLQMADSAIRRFNPQVVHIDFSFYNQQLTDLIRKNNARIWINALGHTDAALGTPKESEAMDNILQFGANIIQTDQPELLLKLLKEKGLHN